ncbi:MAG TPA: stage III sporulation protein AC [Firmicutes bacterium]|nr:stage III sporulation protein AC [Bacillota bacterium]
MDMTDIYRIAGIGLLISVFSMVLKQYGKEDQAVLLTWAGVVVVFMLVVRLISQLFDSVRAVFGL